MIRKPTAEWTQQAEQRGARLRAVGNLLQKLKIIIAAGERKVKGGIFAVHGFVLIGFGLLWIMAGVGSLAGGSIATLIGGGGMGCAAVWGGLRLIRNGKVIAVAPQDKAQPRCSPEENKAQPALRPQVAEEPVRIVAFDADAIIARHLAERERLAAQAQAVPVPLVQPARPAFGRKVT